jgi:hypothetical protein
MTELTEEPQFKVGTCIGKYIETNERGAPDSVLISERNNNYLGSLFHMEKGKLCLRNSAGTTLRVRRIEELSPRKRRKLEAISGIPLYLCQTGIGGRIKTRSIRSYNLENATYNLRQL